MDIKFLGHAGFLVENEKQIMLLDPWLSPNGTFCKSWYQFPKNHHLFEIVENMFSDSKKNKYIYISHEHKDHLDLDFLNHIKNQNFKFIIPNYRSDALRKELRKIKNNEIIEFKDEEDRHIDGFNISIFIDDTGINRDSAILINDGAYTFLNMNDCKIYERSDRLLSKYKKIDFAAIQFSGATWYPVCYDFDISEKNKLFKNKRDVKFNLVKNFLDELKPSCYLPSAGPPCFLSEDLKDINFYAPTQFPDKEQFIDFLNKSNIEIQILSMEPGDVFSSKNNKVVNPHAVPIKASNNRDYIDKYCLDHHEDFSSDGIDFENLLKKLFLENYNKMREFKNKDIQEPFNLYFLIKEYKQKVIEVNFNDKKVKIVPSNKLINMNEYYKISAPGWLYKKIVDKDITWTDFSLTFRARISRKPNIYSSFIQGFILSEIEDLIYLSEMMDDSQNKKERVTVSDSDCSYMVDRYCPHMGADLKNVKISGNKFIVCPRHGWEFDLKNKGDCKNAHNSTINSVKIES